MPTYQPVNTGAWQCWRCGKWFNDISCVRQYAGAIGPLCAKCFVAWTCEEGT